MTELIVVGFKKDMYRASEALNMLQQAKVEATLQGR